jgi:hypothetical protein
MALRPGEEEGQPVEVRLSDVRTSVLEVAHANETTLSVNRVVGDVTM